ncbi:MULTISPECIES: hypothetical protein [Maricaulis]|uniref:Uncharacterized protein n=1 Tax=Maricaulis salignorans TaxID=144026 RepID=A0A1G9N694_9PROT|nr:hypothetical protein [Maricaulis salignorans]SDL82056.1 hypothetical protein SAMN04488568_102233 [Maricaulis salignorans]|tara:strand:- start:22719 stop:22859 length:141 start_codon:yes stop_codon:yes gene_type:complete
MRGFLVGLVVVAGIIAAGFGTLIVIANGLEPSQEEVRVELDDNFPR